MSLMRIWRAPLLFALLTSIGLVSALLGDGWWDDLSTLALVKSASTTRA